MNTGDEAPLSDDGGASALVVVGRIGKPHGLRGEVFVEPWTDDPQDRFAPGSVLTAEPASAGPLTVETARWHAGDKLVLRFEGVPDRTAVEALRGVRLLLAASERPPLEDPDDFYDT